MYAPTSRSDGRVFMRPSIGRFANMQLFFTSAAEFSVISKNLKFSPIKIIRLVLFFVVMLLEMG